MCRPGRWVGFKGSCSHSFGVAVVPRFVTRRRAGLRGALDQLRSNFPQAVATSSVTAGQVVFTAPDTAVATFTLSYSGGQPYGQKNGTAVLRNGRWSVSRDTYCMVLSFGGAQCP